MFNRRTYIIAIVSGKGGVGKTNIAVNLAVTLAAARRGVMLVDFDIGSPDAGLLLNLGPRFTFAHVLSGEKSLTDIIMPGPASMRFVAVGATAASRAEIGPDDCASLLKQLQTPSITTEIIICDCASGISKTALAVAALADSVLVVSSPERTSVTDAYAIIKALVAQGGPGSIQLLLNRVAGRDEAHDVFRRLAAAARRFLNFSLADAGYVVQDNKIETAVRDRRPFVLGDPRCPSSLCIAALAARLDRACDARVATRPAGLAVRLAELFV